MRLPTNALLAAAIAAATTTAAARAADVKAGEALFAQRCAACHAIVTPAGTTVVEGGTEGPNQFGLVGRQAATMPGYAGYGDTLVEAGKSGLVWTEEAIIEYLADPRAFLRQRTGDKAARSKMAYKLRDETERRDVTAYLASLR